MRHSAVYGWVYIVLYMVLGCNEQSPTAMPTNDAGSSGDVMQTDDLRPSVDAQEAAHDGHSTHSGLDGFVTSDGHAPVLDGDSASGSDASITDGQDQGAPPLRAARIRASCLEDEPMETGLDTPPLTCVELFTARPTLESGCYRLADEFGGTEPSYCWRRRALVFLANNEIETDASPDDTNGDGIIDVGPQQGQNFPADPFSDDLNGMKTRLVREIKDWFAEVSYDAIYVDVMEVVTPRVEQGLPERWFRLQQLRPGFAHPDLFTEYCRQQGGMTPDDWMRIDYLVTTISHGTSTSGSQYRLENVPTGQDCEGSFPLIHNYMVVKNFRSWNRLGTMFHEIAHGFNRGQDAEPSLGHSESIQADSGDGVEYGDRSDVMGGALRGHFHYPENVHSGPPGRIGRDRRHRNLEQKRPFTPPRPARELGTSNSRSKRSSVHVEARALGQ